MALLVIPAFLLFWYLFWFVSSTLWGLDSETYGLIVGWIGFAIVIPLAVFGIVASFLWS